MSAIPGVWNNPPTYDSTTTPYLGTTLTPYLTLPHLLSLTWLATPILSLIFVAFRLQLSLADAQNALDKTKVNLLASCLAAERAASSTVSIPRYLALATNKQFSEAVNGAIEGTRIALVLSITIIEAVLNFVIDLYRSTFLCFLELVVRGGLSILISAAQELNQAVQTVSSGLRTTLQQQVETANNVIKTAVDAVNKLNPFNKIPTPNIDVPNLDSLQSVSLPSSFQESLVKLNATIPSVSTIKQKLEEVLNTPFELLKKEINDTFIGLSFNPDGLPIPALSEVTFCGKLDTSVVDDLSRDLLRTVKIGILLLLALAVLLIGLNCLLTWYSWRSLKRHLKFTREAWMSDPTIVHPQPSASAPPITLNDDYNHPSHGGYMAETLVSNPQPALNDRNQSSVSAPQVMRTLNDHNPPPLVAINDRNPPPLINDHSAPPRVTLNDSNPPPQVTLSDHNLMLLGTDWEHPFITRIMNQLSSTFHLTPRQHIHTRWFLHYIFSSPAVACLLIGLFGVLSIELQLIALRPLVAKYRGQAESVISDFSQVIASSINSSMYNQSSAYANDVNGRVDNIQTTINGRLFGWVNGTTTTLNNTISAVYTDVQQAVQLVFGGSILEAPAQEFVRCLIGTKVDAVENAITFLHDHLKVDLPRINQNVLVLSPESVDEATKPIAAAAIGSSSDDNQGFLGKIIQAYVASLKEERVMFLIFIGLWGFVCLMGLVVVLRHSCGQRGKKKFEEEQRAGWENFSGDNEKGREDEVTLDALPPSKRVSIESFWLNTKPSPSISSKSSTNEESTYADLAHVPLRGENIKPAKLGRKVSRGPDSKQDRKDEQQVQQHVQDITSAVDHRDGGWWNKMTSWLGRKGKDGKRESEPVFDEQILPRPRLSLQIAPPERSPVRRSRFSMTPDSTPTWKNLIPPPLKKGKQPPLPLSNTSTGVIVLEPEVPFPPLTQDIWSSQSYSQPAVTPPATENSFAAQSTTAPIPLHAGFDKRLTKPKRLKKGAASRSQPTAPASPKTILYQTPASSISQYPFPPPPRRTSGRRRRSVSSGPTSNTSAQWGVTNAPARDTSPNPLPDISSSAVNPFVTPFDDDHQMRKGAR